MPRRPKKFHFIYKTTNVINEKFYIGMHSTNDLNDGYLGSGKYLWNSIKKYGKDNFKIEILEFLSDTEKLKVRERELVNEDMLKDDLCMNLTMGGVGGTFKGRKHSEETKLKMRETKLRMKSSWVTSEYREKLSNSLLGKNKGNHTNKGRKHTDAAKLKISLSHKGVKLSELHKQKISEGCKLK